MTALRVLPLLAVSLASACSVAALSRGDPAGGGLSTGERAYQKCYACHALTEGDDGADGPHLAGIVGRPVAGLDGYDYSFALERYAASDPRWTRERLDAFLADPQREVPDNAMGFFGIADPAERAALIEYLVRVSKR